MKIMKVILKVIFVTLILGLLTWVGKCLLDLWKSWRGR